MTGYCRFHGPHENECPVCAEAEPIVTCPRCGAEQADLDGFGVIHCESCGFCCHPSITGGTCDLCERTVAA